MDNIFKLQYQNEYVSKVQALSTAKNVLKGSYSILSTF